MQTYFRFFPLHPIAYVTIGYVAGIMAAYGSLNLVAAIYFFIACAGLLYAKATENMSCATKIYILSPLLVVAFLAGIYRAQQQANNFLQLRHAVSNTKWQCTGIVTAIDPLCEKTWHYRLTCNAEKITTAAQEIICATRVIVYSKEKPMCNVGDLVTLHELFCQPTGNNNHYELYLLKENIIATVFCGNQCSISIEEQNMQPWQNLLHNKKISLVSRLQKKLSPITFALWSSLFLGYKDFSKKAIKQLRYNFSYWGISHYLARSAVHALIFLGLFAFVLRAIPVNFFVKQGLLVFLAFLYFLLSWSGISFLRAFIIFCLYKTCIFLHLQIRALYILLLALLGILLVNPAQCYFLDFQLSFGLTFALAWYNERIMSKNNT